MAEPDINQFTVSSVGNGAYRFLFSLPTNHLLGPQTVAASMTVQVVVPGWENKTDVQMRQQAFEMAKAEFKSLIRSYRAKED